MSQSSPAPWAVACLLLGTVALAAPTALSQEDDVLESFDESLDVVVVGVEAVVTDRDGNRVPGLDREDFRLLVDGVEVPIEYFTEVREGVEVIAGTETAAEEREAPPGAPAMAAPPAVTNHLVFVDDYFGIRSYRNTVLQGIRDRLPELPAGDRMALVAFDGEGLDVLAPWTADREELARALDRARKRPAHGLHRAHERRRRGDEGPWSDTVVQEQELDRVLSAVRSTLRVVPRPQGRKVLLLLGGGWPTRSPGYVTEEAVGSPFPELPTGAPFSDLDDMALVEAMADAANLLGYTVYPVDLHGLRSGGGDVEQEAPRNDAATGLADATTGPNTLELMRQGTLRFLAHETGGRALLFGDRTEALARVLDDTRSYYSLGFTPRLRGDGRRHEVRLEVRRPGLEVRARQGYRDVSRAEELDVLVEAALRFDLEGGGAGEAGEAAAGAGADEPSPLVITLGEPRSKGRRTMEVPLRLEVPWGALTLLPSQGNLVARLEIRVAARDREGELSEMARIPFNLVRESPPEPDRMLRWESALTLRRERHALVVSLYDAVSGELLTERVEVEP